MSSLFGILLELLGSIRRVGEMLGDAVEQRLLALRAALREEVRRITAALMLALLAAACLFAALAFAAVAILIAAWPTHPVLAAALIACAFAVIGLLALMGIRSRTR